MFAARSIIEHDLCFEEIERLLHGKCARTIFIHELSSIRKRTSERNERVSFPIRNNE